ISNVVVLVTTLTAMFVLQWQLTLLSLLLLPLFLLPTKRVGRRLQAMTREQMDLNSSMNTTMTERFNVSGALLVKLFGRHDQESGDFADRAGRVRDIGVLTAVYSRTFFIALALVGAVGTALIYWLGGQLVISGTITVGTLVALGTYVAQIYTPLTSLTNARVDLMTAFVSFDRVFEVLDTEHQVTDRPGAVDLVDPVGEIELHDVWFRYPAAADVSLASLELDAGGRDGLSTEASEP
ncbi:MAG: ABC transporter ATP-binding protein, partial [Acidimicrobiales bacterium]|nr:ABC transporter ATP-binding protein [Acidimicrobiales bacterium]